MDETTKIVETPHGKMSNRSSRSSFAEYDSGYLTLTPHSMCHSPIAVGRPRISSTSTKRHLRLRVEPWQSDRITRYRSKFNQLLDNSYCDLSEAAETSSSGNARCSDTGDRSMLSEYQEFGMELRTRNIRNWRATVPVTPASKMEILSSSPPSPAIPSSSFQASEPTEDVEMNLMKLNEHRMQQSTPHTSPTSFQSIRKSSPIFISAENRRLSRLAISELATVPEIKPKRLDFSQQGLTASLRRSRAMRDFTGTENVDMLLLLGEKSNHWRIVSKILGLLSPQDLCSVSMVSKAWKRICANDSKSNVRRLAYVILRQDLKENLKYNRKLKLESDINTSPRSRYTRKGYLLEVQNLLQVPQKAIPPNSPPVSPSKVKFHSFVKVILFSEIKKTMVFREIVIFLWK